MFEDTESDGVPENPQSVVDYSMNSEINISDLQLGSQPQDAQFVVRHFVEEEKKA